MKATRETRCNDALLFVIRETIHWLTCCQLVILHSVRRIRHPANWNGFRVIIPRNTPNICWHMLNESIKCDLNQSGCRRANVLRNIQSVQNRSTNRNWWHFCEWTEINSVGKLEATSWVRSTLNRVSRIRLPPGWLWIDFGAIRNYLPEEYRCSDLRAKFPNKVPLERWLVPRKSIKLNKQREATTRRKTWFRSRRFSLQKCVRTNVVSAYRDGALPTHTYSNAHINFIRPFWVANGFETFYTWVVRREPQQKNESFEK